MSHRSMQPSRRARRAAAATASVLRCACEPLEMRRLFTSVLYLDFGDNLPAGGLNVTNLQMRDTFGNNGLQGPDLTQPDNAATAGVNEAITDATTFNITNTAQFVTFDYNNDGFTNNTDYTDLRAAVLTLAQQYYAPFDVNVQIAPAVNNATSADYINGVRATLQLGANTDGEYDGYVFIGNVTRVGDGASIGGISNLNGISNGADIDDENEADNSEFVFADQIFAGATNTDVDTRLAYTAAHEGGHDFGLRHTNNGNNTSGNAQTDADMALQTGSNLVTGSAGAVNRTNFDFVTRFPLVRGDNNTIQNGNTFDITDTRIPYDRLANPNNLGLRAGSAAYVTGTGAFDEITISPGAAGFANIAVETHRDTSFNNQIGATYSYSVPLGNGVLLEAGFSTDRIIIDGTIAANFTIRGNAGNDQIIVDGNNTATGTYTPGSATPTLLDDNVSFLGTLNLSGGANISLEEFDLSGSITVQEVQNLTYVTPNSADDLTLDTSAAGSLRVTGSTGGVNVAPLIFNNVASFTLDTGANDGGSADDDVLVNAAAPSTGLNTLSITTGAGSDELDINFATGNVIPAGGLSFNAGIDVGPVDLLNLRGGSFTNEVYTPSAPDSGTIDLDGSVISYFNLAPINDTVVAATVTFHGTAAADTINLIDSGTFNGFDTTQINSPSFELVNFANKATVRVAGENGADVVNVNLTDPADGMTSLLLDGEDATNSGDDNAADRFNVVPAAGSLPITVSGGGGAGDILAVNGSTGDFDITNTTITSAGVQSITYGTVERLELTSGIFEVVGNVATPIHVNSAATLIGTGTASGGITANSGGIVSPGIGGPGVLGSGNLAFNGGSNYTLQLNGTGAGLHDELNVTGTVNLNITATLSATVGGGFVSIPGDEIVIIRNDGVDAVNGVFAGGNLLDFGAGGRWTIDYGYDADGTGVAFNDVALIRYGAQLAPDPCDPTKQALFVSSTSGADLIEIKPVTGTASGEVFINGVSEGVFSWDGHLYVMGQNGDDTINCLMPSREVFLYGNTGNDTLNGGNNLSVLIGGFGNDVLTSGSAMDILIGGDGRDRLQGENAADIIITGGSVYDAVTAANRITLCEIADLWRAGHQTSSLGGLLNNLTLISDGDVDTAMGGLGKDYLILGVNDIDDSVKQETILFV